MKVVICAGGKGTRISELDNSIPKPMFRLNEKPILEHQIEVLVTQGYTDIIMTIGYLGDSIRNYFEDGSRWGACIKYICEEQPLGTAGALYYLKKELQDSEYFLLLNGDIIFDIDINKFCSFHEEKKGMATIIVHPNDHPYDSGLISMDSNGTVIRWLHKEDERTWYKNRVNAGIHILSTKVLDFDVFDKLQKVDLDRDILKPMISNNALFAYQTCEYIKDMGTPERYSQVEKDLLVGKVFARNRLRKQKAIFVDRDGTINEMIPFLKSIDDFKLLPNVSQAIAKINQSNYLCIVVTNQPVIARGDLTEAELELIHDKMETLLGYKGAYIDGIYYCPHHPDRGFDGERIEYKIDCTCRKPKPGMLLQAAAEYNIDLSQSWMIGDSVNDVKAGKAAGCKTGLIGEEQMEISDISGKSLFEIIERIL